jgi:hypothetical protein
MAKLKKPVEEKESVEKELVEKEPVIAEEPVPAPDSNEVSVRELDGGKVELAAVIDSTETDELNAELRKRSDKGLTFGKTFRHVANIDEAEFNMLVLLGDKNAVDFKNSGYTDLKSLRRLLLLHPDWRCSEGAI